MRRRVLEWHDPAETLGVAVRSSGLEYLRMLLDGAVQPPPMALLMNIRIEAVDRGRVVFAATPGEEHYNPHGSVHGGWAATLFDTALGCAVHSTLELGQGYTTLDLNVHFVRAILHTTGPMRCEARVLHGGKRIVTADATLTSADGALYAHATTTCLILDRGLKSKAALRGSRRRSAKKSV